MARPVSPGAVPDDLSQRVRWSGVESPVDSNLPHDAHHPDAAGTTTRGLRS